MAETQAHGNFVMISIDKAEFRNQKIGPWAASGEDSSIGLGSVSYSRERERMRYARALFFN